MSNMPRAIKHGTIGGYQAERRRGVPHCGSCLTAWRMYWQAYNGSLPRRVFLRKKAEEKRTAALRKAAKARECEVRKQKRAASRLSKGGAE